MQITMSDFESGVPFVSDSSSGVDPIGSSEQSQNIVGGMQSPMNESPVIQPSSVQPVSEETFISSPNSNIDRGSQQGGIGADQKPVNMQGIQSTQEDRFVENEISPEVPERTRSVVNSVVSEKLKIFPNDPVAAITELSQGLESLQTQRGLDPKDVKNAAITEISANLGQEFLYSVTWTSDRLVSKLQTVKGACERGSVLEPGDYAQVLESLKNNVDKGFRNSIQMAKDSGYRKPPLSSLDNRTAGYTGLDGYIFLTRQAFGEKAANQLKDEYYKITGQQYQQVSRDENMKFLKISQDSDLLRFDTLATNLPTQG